MKCTSMVMSIYGITGGKLQNTSPDGTVREMEVADGFVGHRNTVTNTHQMKNIGDTTVKVILVEHKKAWTNRSSGHPRKLYRN